MICIFCRHETEVTNSRSSRSAPSVWRRRACKHCVAQFTTIELPDYSKSFLVMGSDTKKPAPFERDILFISIHQALMHRVDAATSAAGLTTTIIRQILKVMQKRGSTPRDNVIPRSLIAGIAIKALKRYDPLAAATYKAYHQAALKDS